MTAKRPQKPRPQPMPAWTARMTRAQMFRLLDTQATLLRRAMIAADIMRWRLLDWGYPNPIVVQIKQFAQNGLNIPTFTEASMDTDVADHLIAGKILADVYDVNYCNVFSASPAPALKAFPLLHRAT